MRETTAEAQGIPVLRCDPEPQRATRRLVIWLPGFGGNKEAMAPYLRELAAAGFTALSFDPFQHGARRMESQAVLQERVTGNIRRWFWPILHRTAEEVSQVLDWAGRTLEVEPGSGLGGISMGGDISVAAAGLDRRVRAVSAGIATPDWLRPGSHEAPGLPDAAAWQAYRAGNPLTHAERYAHAPAIAFECGAEDTQVPPAGAQLFAQRLEKYYRAAPERLRVTLHAGVAHQFTPAMWASARDWFMIHLLGGEAQP